MVGSSGDGSAQYGNHRLTRRSHLLCLPFHRRRPHRCTHDTLPAARPPAGLGPPQVGSDAFFGNVLMEDVLEQLVKKVFPLFNTYNLKLSTEM